MTKLYGKARFDPETKLWVLDLGPDAMARFKRIFPKIPTKAMRTATLSPTPANARDLLWALDRYPLAMTPRDLAKLRGESQRHKEQESVLDTMLAAGYVPKSYAMALPPREYQRLVPDLVFARGWLLCADMLGLGKTVSGICVLSDPRARPGLVIVPTHLPTQWVRQIDRFLPGMRTHVLTSGKPYDLVKACKGTFPDVVVTSYSKMTGWAPHLSKLGFKSLIYDEIQALIHEDTARYAAALHLRDAIPYRCGFSVGPDSIVELRGGPFGSGWVGAIYAATEIIANLYKANTASGYDLFDTNTEHIEARGWTASGFGWKTVRTFIRHKCVKRIRSIRAAGDHLWATDDHSVYVLDEQGMSTRSAADLSVGDILPADNGGAWDAANEADVDVIALAAVTRPRASVHVNLSGVTREAIGANVWQWANYRRQGKYGHYLPIDVFVSNASKLPKPSCVYVGTSRGAYRVSPRVRLSDWAYILGFFLGDGWIEKNRVSFAVETDRVESIVDSLLRLPNVELHPTVFPRGNGGSCEVRCNNAIFVDVLRMVMGKVSCYEKKIPGEWIISWPEHARRELLRGLIDSDGHRRKQKHGYRFFCTTSLALARTLLSLLRSLGAIGGISHRRQSDGGVINGRRIKPGPNSYTVYWSKYAEIGDNDGHHGARHKFSWTNGISMETPVRYVKEIEHERWPEFVYDLEMAGHPSFVANGVLVHNTATPLHNKGIEVHNILVLLGGDEVGPTEEFSREHCNGGRYVSDPKALGMTLRRNGWMIRRTTKEVDRELPDMTRVVHPIECNLDSITTVQAEVVDLATRLLRAGGDGLDKMQAGNDLDWKLREATGVGKAPHVAAFVKMLLESDVPVLLSGWHRRVYAVWMDLLREYKPVLYTGSETLTQKEASREAFLKGRTNLFIISNRSGSGLDGLQHRCSTVVIGELDWTPAWHDQVIGRVHRDEQTSPVFAHFPVADEGSDPMIADVLGLKRAQIDGICDPDAALIQKLQAPQERMKHLAAAWLAKHRPDVLADLDTERAELAQQAEEEKQRKVAEREARRIERAMERQAARM